MFHPIGKCRRGKPNILQKKKQHRAGEFMRSAFSCFTIRASDSCWEVFGTLTRGAFFSSKQNSVARSYERLLRDYCQMMPERFRSHSEVQTFHEPRNAPAVGTAIMTATMLALGFEGKCAGEIAGMLSLRDVLWRKRTCEFGNDMKSRPHLRQRNWRDRPTRQDG